MSTSAELQNTRLWMLMVVLLGWMSCCVRASWGVVTSEGETVSSSSRLATTDGMPVQIHWKRWSAASPTSTPPPRLVLFHHGWNGDLGTFAATAEKLAATGRFSCVAFDARGTGASSRPPHERDHSLPHLLSDVIAVADFHWGPDSQFVYVGHSMGGMIGFAMGLWHSSRVEKLVLVAPAPSGGLGGFPEQQYRDGLSKWRRAKAGDQTSFNQLVKETVDRMPVVPGRPAEECQALARSDVERRLKASDGHYAGCWTMMKGFDESSKLNRITVPALIVSGAHDSLLKANTADAKALKRGSRHVVIPHAGHNVHGDQPQRFMAALLQFLDPSIPIVELDIIT